MNTTLLLNARRRERGPLRLLALLARPDPPTERIALEFRLFAAAIRSLPEDRPGASVATRWLSAAEGLWRSGERGAARYQIGLLNRKLGSRPRASDHPRGSS